ncbi:MAG: sulfate permease [Planctomycetes bacterium]|nr:sulfate permease [Planctomycetota bacterium]
MPEAPASPRPASRARSRAPLGLRQPPWWKSYRRGHFVADLLAGLVVAALLVPQAMAYAMLAGLPAQAGLVSCLAPLVVYALLGTSRTLSVGPVAIVSLLVADGLAMLGPLSTERALAAAALLALEMGLLQLAMGLLRAGFLVNFLSHPVVLGYTSAAALVIAFSQAKHLLGLAFPRDVLPWETLVSLATHVGETKAIALLVGGGAIALLALFPRVMKKLLARAGSPRWLRALAPRCAPLLVVVGGTALAYAFGLHASAGLAVVGEVPPALPSFELPAIDLELLRALLPAAAAIACLGFLESYSVAQTLASRRREHVHPSRELVALGCANLASACTGGFPVSGGVSRSMANAGAGARSQVASLATALFVLLTVLALTPLLRHLPRAILAAIIVMAVAPLLDLGAARRIWKYSKADGWALIATFVGVFALGVGSGIAVGVLLSLSIYLARSARPHIAVVGRVGDSESYRNVKRYQVHVDPRVLAIRIDENLMFSNVRYLEQRIPQLVAQKPGLKHVLLIASGINLIDASGLRFLELVSEMLASGKVELHLAEVKGPVMDKLERADFPARLGRDHFHLSTHEAMERLAPSESSG